MMAIELDKINEIKLKANDIRQSIIKALCNAGSGHTAGSLGMADIFATIYFYILNHNPKRPEFMERDRVVLSNGHICPVLYATMAHSGYFSVSDFEKSLRKFGSQYQGHPHREWLPSIETSSGPLGSGLSQLVGMAIGDRIDRHNFGNRYFYGFLSDGELQSGNTWEAIMLAGKEKLGKIIVFVDRNGIQITGFTEQIMPLEPLADKWYSYNWNVYDIDGHNIEEIVYAVGHAKTVSDKPSVILARTIPGKGVPFMEGDFKWHGKTPNADEAGLALEYLRMEREKIC